MSENAATSPSVSASAGTVSYLPTTSAAPQTQIAVAKIIARSFCRARTIGDCRCAEGERCHAGDYATGAARAAVALAKSGALWSLSHPTVDAIAAEAERQGVDLFDIVDEACRVYLGQLKL